MLKQIVVDLDGTIALLPKGSRAFLEADVNKPLVLALLKLKHKGYRLILDTARGDKRRGKEPFSSISQQVEQEVMGWLIANGLEYLFDEIRMGSKRYAELYVDDKGIPPQALLSGISTAEAWANFAQSAYFKTAIANFASGANVIHLPLSL